MADSDQALSSHIDDPGVPAADPEHITQLWQDVMSCPKEGGKTQELSSEPDSTAKVSDSDFEESVLTPYGITIQTRHFEDDLYNHFSLSKLPKDPMERFNTYKNELPLEVWLAPDNERITCIQENYSYFQRYDYNEATYRQHTIEEIFHDQDLNRSVSEQPVPIRTIQYIQKPTSDTDKARWMAPPRFDLSGKQYEWKTRSDCAYYVSLGAFPDSIRCFAKDYVPIVYSRAFLPYLTIDFEKPDQTLETALNQVALASTIALYNRWFLKRRLFGKTNQHNDWSKEDKDGLRHYCLVFRESIWELFCTTPKTFTDWSGCTMLKLRRGDGCERHSAQLLLEVLNDIHYWGLTVHGASCVADIDTIIRGRTGGIPWALESMEDLNV